MRPLSTTLALGVALLMRLSMGTSVQAAAATPPTANNNTTTVTLVATDPTALIGASTGAFTFIRTGPTNADLQVAFAYSGTAVFGTDFDDATSTFNAPGPRYVTILKGFYATDLVIEPKLNPNLRGNKTVDVTLDAVALGALSASADAKHATAEVRIIDDTYNDSPPSVSLSTPANNSTITLPATVVITADATDLEDSIQKVSFYADDTFLGSATAPGPFTFSWVNPDVGDYALFARAVDAAGKSTLSLPIHVTVTGVTPTVSFITPLDKSSFDPNTDVPIQVQATGIGALTVRITLDGNKVLGELKTPPPYQLTWSKVPAGKHTLTASVTDSAGQTATASIQVSVADLPPTVQITNPSTGGNFVEGTDITLDAKATDPDDNIKEVTFWANHRLLGKGSPTAADPSVYEFKWSSPKANFYLIQAIATNSNGTTATSDAVYVSVSKK
jgi:hypothetical protein